VAYVKHVNIHAKLALIPQLPAAAAFNLIQLNSISIITPATIHQIVLKKLIKAIKL
jgi:hypothetical protein